MPLSQPEKICPLCRKDASYLFLQDYKYEGKNFSLYECKVCGGQFWHPFKNPGADWYINQDKFNVKDALKPRSIHAYHKYFIKSHAESLKNSRILDLGCGTGEFLAELEKRGAFVYGTDIDIQAIAMAQNNYNLKNIFNLPITEFLRNQSLPQFDYLTVFEVFEHVDDTWSILSESKKFIKPGGRLVISTPTRERPLVNSAGWDYPYHHLSRWDEKSIRYHLVLSGYENIKVIYINKFHQLYELFLEVIAAKLKFNKAAGLKQIANENKLSNSKNKASVKKMIIRIIYKAGRFFGVVLAPYLLAAIFFPVSLIFYPRSGIMYIEVIKK
jgi:SAM-dependent methyltransferase